MPQFTDQLKRKLKIETPAKRIVSLVPSQTELLADLGLTEEVVGITKFCIHPEKWFRTKPRIGGTKKISIEKIRALHPDLIIGNKEENEQYQVEELMKEFPVWMSDIQNLEDALEMIENVALITGKTNQGLVMKNQVQERFLRLAASHYDLRKPAVQPAVLYLVWKDPYMAVGGDTFIHDMLVRCGLRNCTADLARYPELTADEIAVRKPDFVFLSSEPYPFGDIHRDEIAAICPGTKAWLVNGEYFSWYGSRLLKAPDYFRSLLSELNAKSF